MQRACLYLLVSITVLLPTPTPAGVGGFPLGPGSTWEYENQDGSRDVLRIDSCRPYMNIPVCTASFNRQGSFYLIPTNGGLFRLNFDPAVTSAVHDREMTLIVGPSLEPGTSWSSPWGRRPLVFQVVATEDMTVPAGYISNAYKIGYRAPVDPIYEGYVWYAPGVGIVAQEENNTRSNLVQFSPSEMLPPEPADIRPSDLALLVGFPPPDSRAPAETDRTSLPGYLLPLLVTAILVLMAIVVVLAVRRGGRQLELSGSEEVSEGEILVARAMVKDGLFEEAIEILERLTRAHPDWPDLAADLGRAYLEREMHAEAAVELKRALTLNSDLLIARIDLAKALLAVGEPAGALSEAEAVLAEHPGWADALYLKGEAVRLLGNSNAARDHFQRALEMNPHFDLARDALERLGSEE